MRLARSYLDDWYHNKAADGALSYAAKYVEQARRKDPSARLPVERKKGDATNLDSLNDMAGEILYCQALSQYEPTAPRERLLRVVTTLNKALEYTPYSISCRAKLADVYLNLHDKQSALRIAQDAVKISPINLDARKLLDKIEAAPITRPETDPELLVLLGILGMITAVCLIIASMFVRNLEGLSFVLLVGGFIVWMIGRARSRHQLFRKALAEQKRKSEK